MSDVTMESVPMPQIIVSGSTQQLSACNRGHSMALRPVLDIGRTMRKEDA